MKIKSSIIISQTSTKKRTLKVRVTKMIYVLDKSLSVSFGGLKALSNINLDLHSNEVVGLIGPNGAGKTTLFNALSGLVDVDAGSLEINGKAHKWPKPYGLVDLGISRTLQGVGLFPELTVLENVMVGDSKSSKSGLISSALGLNGKDLIEL